MRTSRALAAVAGFVVLAAIQAQGDVAYNYPGALVGNGGNGPFTIGNVFTVNSTIDVNQLGYFDSAGAPIPLGQNLSVAIYKVSILSDELQSSTLVVNSTTFNTATPGTLVPATTTRLTGVHDTLLGPGTYMVVANNYGNHGALPYYDTQKVVAGQISGNTTGGYLSFDGSFLETGVVPLGASLPDLTDWSFFDTSHPRMGAGNFGFLAIVPEASTFGGVFVALLGLVYIGRLVWLKNYSSNNIPSATATGQV